MYVYALSAVFNKTKDRARLHRSMIWCDVKKWGNSVHHIVFCGNVPDLLVEAGYDGEAGHLQPPKISTYSKSIFSATSQPWWEGVRIK